jgi:hypothetical protein
MSKRRLLIDYNVQDKYNVTNNTQIESKQTKQYKRHSWNYVPGGVLDIIFECLEPKYLVKYAEATCKSWFTHSVNGIGWRRNCLDITVDCCLNVPCLERIIFVIPRELSESCTTSLSNMITTTVKTATNINNHMRLTRIHQIQHLTVALLIHAPLSQSLQNNLSTLTIYITYRLDDSHYLKQVFQHLTSLTSLTIINSCKYTILSLPKIPTLCSLTIETASTSNSTYVNFPFSYPQLTKLYIGFGVICTDDMQIERFTSPLLEDFKLCGSIRFEKWREIVQNAGLHLTSLENHSFSLGYADVEDLVNHCPALKSLKFIFSTLTNFPIFVYEYIRQLKRLEQLRSLEIITPPVSTRKYHHSDFEYFSTLSQLTTLRLPGVANV